MPDNIENSAVRYIDLDTGLGRVRGNKTLFKRMLAMFLDSDEIAKLNEALSDGDIEEAAKASHAIKGVAGNLSLPVLFECSSELHVQLRAGVLDPHSIDAYHNALEQTVSAVKETIARLET